MSGVYSSGASASESTDQMMKSLAKYLPTFLDQANSAVLPSAEASLKAAQRTSPFYQEIAEKENVRQTQSDTNLLNAHGGDYSKALTNIQKQFDPEFYSGNADISKSFKALDDSYSLNGLSNGEAAAAERGINKTNIKSGNFGTNSALTTLGNLRSFGDAYDKKRAAKSANLTSWGNFNPSTKSGFNAGAIGSKDIGTGFKTFGNIGSQGVQTANSFGSGLSNLANTSMTQKGAGLQALDAS